MPVPLIITEIKCNKAAMSHKQWKIVDMVTASALLTATSICCQDWGDGRARPKGPKLEGRDGAGVLGEGQLAPSPPAKGSGGAL